MDFSFIELDVNNEEDLDWLYSHVYEEGVFNMTPPQNKEEDKEDFKEYILKESLGFRYKVSLGEEAVALANFPNKKHPGQLQLSVSREWHEKISGKDILKAMRSHKDIPKFHEFFIWDKQNIPYLAFVGSAVCKNKVKGLKVPSISGRCYCCNYVSQQDGSVLLMAGDCLVEEDCDC